jgi:D-hydroxyproline dehydrogenase subunit alpha
MNNDLRQSFDVLVVGGGPAGIAAAVRAAEAGAQVAIADENSALGGQIWRGGSAEKTHSPESSHWRTRLRTVGVSTLCGKRVFHQSEDSVLLAESAEGLSQLRYRNLILATGARERFLPFPGWTLPNVTGAGGLQALVKSGLPICGKRVVVAGTGPLLLAVACYLRRQGAEILLICEQACWSKLIRFGIALFGHAGKIGQSLQLAMELRGIPFAANSWPLMAHGSKVLEAVTISRAGKPKTLQCDYLACGFHLVPNSELPILLSCRTRNGYVQVNEFQQTSVEGIFCAGEPTGVGGVDLALIEGQIAGLAAVGRKSEAQALFSKREKLRRFTRLLGETFCLRPELRSLPSADTLVCRCEDVPFSRLREHTSWRAAKLHTRCGMGACQGRICGPATEFLFQWNPDSVRPPVFPARVENLAVLPTHSPVRPQPSAAVTGEHE